MTKQSDFIQVVRDWCNRTTWPDALVLTFVRLCEERINANLRANSLGLVTTVLLSSVDNTITLPTDWLESVYVRPAGGQIYKYANPDDFFQGFTVNTVDYAAGNYTNIGGTLSLSPAVADGTQIELCYYNRLPPLTNDTTNFVFDFNNSVYLYGSVAEAFKYLNDPDAASQAENLFMSAIQAVNDYTKRATTSGSPLRRRSRSFG